MLTRKEYEKAQRLESEQSQIYNIIRSLEDSTYLETKFGLINRYNCDDNRSLRSLSLNDEAKWFEVNMQKLSAKYTKMLLKELRGRSKELKNLLSHIIKD